MDVPLEYLVFKVTIFKRCAFIISVICVAALLLKQGGFAVGCFIGGLISVLNFSLLYKYVLALRGLSRQRRKRFLIPKSLLIYLIMGLTLFIAAKKGMPVFFGAAAGIFSLKIALFWEVFRGRECQAMNS